MATHLKAPGANTLASSMLKIVKKPVIVGLIIVIVIAIFVCLKINKTNLWKLYTSLQSQPGSNQQNNLPKKIAADVDKALDAYNQLEGNRGQVSLPKPIYSEKPIDNTICYTEACKSLGGEMRLCSPWVENCPTTKPPLVLN